MYSPKEQATIDEKITNFIERKTHRSAWDTIKKAVAEWREPSVDQRKTSRGGIVYEPAEWSTGAVSRTSFRKLAH
jgi:predicted methyltransferase